MSRRGMTWAWFGVVASSVRPLLLLLLLSLPGCAGGTANGSALATPIPSASPVPFARIEGVYTQSDRSFLVTFQGWWVDTRVQSFRQLRPRGGASFDYGPGWRVETPVKGKVKFHLRAEGIADRVTGTGENGLVIDASRMITEDREVRIPNGDVTLAGTLRIPPGPGPHAAAVLVHGSGRTDRQIEDINAVINLNNGMAVLAYDKRGVGESTGRWPGEQATTESIPIYASDAAAVARFLMTQPGIDPHRVGFLGGSQAGWIIPMATAQVPGIHFDVILSGPTVTTDQQELYAGFSSGSTVIPTESDAEIDRQVRAITSGFDPAPYLQRLDVPTLFVWGELDRQVPVRIALQDVARYHKPNWTVDVLPLGSHGLDITQHGLFAEGDRGPGFAGDYLPRLRSWLAAYALN